MKNKKILIIALFLILFCLLGCSKCFASVSYTYNGNKITLPEIPEKEGYTNYLVYYVNDNPNIVQLKLFPTDLSYYPNVLKANNNLTLGTYTSSTCAVAPSYSYKIETGKDWAKESDSGVVGVTSRVTVVACTTDIYYRDFEGKLDDEPFFQPTPQVVLAPQVEKIQLSQTLEEVLGILPLILVVVVSFLGLRKGLKMLVTFLRQS